MSLHALPYESYRLLQMGVFYVLAAFALAGVRARLQTPLAVAREDIQTFNLRSAALSTEMVSQSEEEPDVHRWV